ncbi:MAG TPA: AAA family ATPase [Firmicutes bacterium]|nr:AAA family ATPase [Bacillota bacterium]
MKSLLSKWQGKKSGRLLKNEDKIKRQVDALYELVGRIYGADKLVLKAGKLDALALMRSRQLSDRVLALQRIVCEDPTLECNFTADEIPRVLEEIEETLAEYIARRNVEESIEKKIAQKMQERHEEYVKELKIQILKEEAGPDNAQTLRKFAELEKLEKKHLSRSVIEALRPKSVDEVVGQDRAIKALFAKIASPFPQHVLLYGPPGVGKTTVARLALEYAKELPYTPFDKDAPFVEVNGATLRWDPREVTNPLLGSVHDPIYQGARRDLADSAVPEPKPGLVTEAHGGVLFIDEIGELDPMLHNKLLKVLEDKRVRFDSSYYDPHDTRVPKYIKKLFEEGAPADFILIGATTRDPSEINPAFRSRCAEVFFDPLNRRQVMDIVNGAAKRLHVSLAPGVAEMISEYTVEGRKATSLLADAYSVALYRRLSVAGGQMTPHAAARETEAGAVTQTAGEAAPAPGDLVIELQDIKEVVRISRLTPYVHVKASPKPAVGRIFGLAVSGYLGSVIEIEAVAFPAAEAGKGLLRFNQTAGKMASDSVFNASSVVRRITGENLADWDIHINVVGGGRIDGPSAGAAVALAIISSIMEWPVRQDIAVTGEVSIHGKIKPVGGVYEKIYGARQAGIVQVLIPEDNAAELPPAVPDIEVVPVATLEEMLPHVFSGAPGRQLAAAAADGGKGPSPQLLPYLKRQAPPLC